ncbi:VOC family protein [Herpetosiphon sp. NSE202]|uniref:VOC family protein n=1 Tax=Herpetosiphon sp. NSE202 TaxID=3351349 RepID=UPI003631F4A8
MATFRTITPQSIDAATTLGVTTLRVADAGRSLAFYRDLLGFHVLEQTASTIVLGSPNHVVLRLEVEADLKRHPSNVTGLYHAAILLPTRLDLAYMVQRLIAVRYRFGASDHAVSEALYLDDPDGNGLEIYRDRSRSEWRWGANGEVHMVTESLDLYGVLAEITPNAPAWAGIPAGTTIGHMHLQVGNLRQAEEFYHGVLGFDIVAHYPGALFVSAGGYHHHLGLNVWQSQNGPQQPNDAAGLAHFEIVMANQAALDSVRQRLAAADIAVQEHPNGLVVLDPWQTELRFIVAA